jgi:hypothetical protein
LVAVAALAVCLFATGLSAAAQSRPVDAAGHWAEGHIAQLIARGVIGTASDGLIRPNEAVTRGQFIAWLVAARGLPAARAEQPFTDVPSTHAMAGAITTAAAYGILPAGVTFRPDSPLARGDAFVWMVRALGYTFEASYMNNAAMPFRDVGGLPPVVRGAIAVVALAVPPILREPAAERVRPRDAMTRAEAASLIWGYIESVERGIALSFTVSLGSGVTLVLEKRGALRVLPVWRVQVGAFQDEERARRLAEALRARGLAVAIDLEDDLFKVRVGNFTTREEAEVLLGRMAAEGLPAWTVQTVPNYESLAGPFWTGAVIVEPSGGARLRPALAAGDTIGRGRPSDAARRAGAIAAVNGGFFASGGAPVGCLVIDGEVISEPRPGRTCVGITNDGQLLFGMPRLAAVAASDVGRVAISGVNRTRGVNEIVLYGRAHGSSTRTNSSGVEVVVADETVVAIADGRGNSPIPPGGYVLSGHGRGRAALLEAFRPGDRVALRTRLTPGGDPRWEQVRHVIGGGPRLLADGQFAGGEGFRASFADRRHPRTAIGRLADGRIVLVVVGGRHPYHSLGMSLVELALMLRQWGVTDALNLDGGGSTTLVIRGVVTNLPSEEGGERPVSDVILVLPPDAPPLPAVPVVPPLPSPPPTPEAPPPPVGE